MATLKGNILATNPPAPPNGVFTNGAIISGLYIPQYSSAAWVNQFYTPDANGNVTPSAPGGGTFTGMAGIAAGYAWTGFVNPAVNWGPKTENTPTVTWTPNAAGQTFYNSSAVLNLTDPSAISFNAAGDAATATATATPSSVSYTAMYYNVGGAPFYTDALGNNPLVSAFTYQTVETLTPATATAHEGRIDNILTNTVTIGAHSLAMGNNTLWQPQFMTVFYGSVMHLVCVGVTDTVHGYPTMQPGTVVIDGSGNLSVFTNAMGNGSGVVTPGNAALADASGVALGSGATTVWHYNPNGGPTTLLADTGASLSTIGLSATDSLQEVTGNGTADYYATQLNSSTFLSTMYHSVGSMSSFAPQALTSGGNPTLNFLNTGSYVTNALWFESGVLHGVLTELLPGPVSGNSYLLSFTPFTPGAGAYAPYPLPPVLPAACIPSCGDSDAQ